MYTNFWRSFLSFNALMVLSLSIVACGPQTITKSTPSAQLALTAYDPNKTNFTESLISASNARQIGYIQGWAKALDLGSNIKGYQVNYLPKLELVTVLQQPSNLLTAISAKTGEVLWDSLIGGRNDDMVGVTHNKNFVLVSSDRKIWLLDPRHGVEKAMHHLETSVTVTPAVMNDDAVFGALNGLVFAHDLRTGGSRWRYRLRGGILVNPVANERKETVFLADRTGFYALMDNRKGEHLWQGRANAAVTTQPIMGTSQIFMTCEDHNMYSIKQIDGTDQQGWPYRTNYPLRHDAELLDRYIFVRVEKRGKVAIDTLVKKELWEGSDEMHPMAIQGRALVAWEGNAFQLYNMENGKKINEVPVQPLSMVVKMNNGSLLLASPECRLLRIDPIR